MSQSVFELDKQTLDDLAIFQNVSDNNSIFNLFNNTITIGGRERLEQIFNHPLTDVGQVSQRIAALKYLQRFNIRLNIDRPTCDFIEFYLKQGSKPQAFFKAIALLERLIYAFNNNNNYYVIQQGVTHILKLIKVLNEFTEQNDYNLLPPVLQNFHSVICKTLEDDAFIGLKEISNKVKLNALDIAHADKVFRDLGYDELKILLSIVYELDVFISVASTGARLKFSLPVVSETGEPNLIINGLFHPFINNPVGNDIEFETDKNICFVTGANMAGKSTFLKSIGIAVFLSQLGFPVPAAYMETSVFDGLITTINLGDNIQQGSSHFYTEVLRVKHVATKMNQSQNMVVIFDELFRGTNVKDAYDASLSIIVAFAKLRKSFFVISTHIVEVANELKLIENVNFKFMETTFDNGTPQYSYILMDGITEERLGMWIVKNEGIVDIIEGIVDREKGD